MSQDLTTCEGLADWLNRQQRVTVVEADMDPEHRGLGRCQFLVNLPPEDGAEDLPDTLRESEANFSRNRMGAYNVALPPE